MKRLLLLSALAACTNSNQRGEVEAPVTEAERMFVDDALPVLQTNCTSCHASVSDPSIAFLTGDTWSEIRASLLESSVVADPLTNSLLLTKGAHSGPSLNVDEQAAIIRWLAAEQP